MERKVPRSTSSNSKVLAEVLPLDKLVQFYDLYFKFCEENFGENDSTV